MQPCITAGHREAKEKQASTGQLPAQPAALKSPQPVQSPLHTHTHTHGEKQALLLLCTKHETTPSTTPQLRDAGFPQTRLPRYLRQGLYKNTVRWTAVMGERTCSTMACTACRSHCGRHNGQRRKVAQMAAAPTRTNSRAHGSVCKHFVLNKQYSHHTVLHLNNTVTPPPSENIATNLRAALEDSSRVSPYHTTARRPTLASFV